MQTLALNTHRRFAECDAERKRLAILCQRKDDELRRLRQRLQQVAHGQTDQEYADLDEDEVCKSVLYICIYVYIYMCVCVCVRVCFACRVHMR